MDKRSQDAPAMTSKGVNTVQNITTEQLLDACEASTQAFNLLHPDKIDAPKYCIDRTGLLAAVLFAKGYKNVIIRPGGTTIKNPEKDEGLVVGQSSMPGSEASAHVLVVLNARYVLDVAAPFDWLSVTGTRTPPIIWDEDTLLSNQTCVAIEVESHDGDLSDMAFQARSIAYGITTTSTTAVAEVLGIKTTELLKQLDWQAIWDMNKRSTDALDVFAMFVGHTSISGAIDHLSGRSSKEIKRIFQLGRPPHLAKAMFSYWRFLKPKLAQMKDARK